MMDTHAGVNRHSCFCPHCGHSLAGWGRAGGGRESIWSVSAEWKTAFFAIFSVLTLMTGCWLTAHLIANRGDAALAELYMTITERVFINSAALALAIYSITETWETTMVLANHLRQRLLEPLKERQRMEGREAGLAEGRMEGREEGRAESDAAWRAWNERREKAAASGEPFDEPPPTFGG